MGKHKLADIEDLFEKSKSNPSLAYQLADICADRDSWCKDRAISNFFIKNPVEKHLTRAKKYKSPTEHYGGRTDPAALCNIAHCHLKGIGTERDVDLGIRLYTQLTDTGNMQALHFLGKHYLGKKKKESKAPARDFFKRAADLGDPSSASFLGVCYHIGIGGGKNPEKAVEFSVAAFAMGVSTNYVSSTIKSSGNLGDKRRGLAMGVAHLVVAGMKEDVSESGQKLYDKIVETLSTEQASLFTFKVGPIKVFKADVLWGVADGISVLIEKNRGIVDNPTFDIKVEQIRDNSILASSIVDSVIKTLSIKKGHGCEVRPKLTSVVCQVLSEEDIYAGKISKTEKRILVDTIKRTLSKGPEKLEEDLQTHDVDYDNLKGVVTKQVQTLVTNNTSLVTPDTTRKDKKGKKGAKEVSSKHSRAVPQKQKPGERALLLAPGATPSLDTNPSPGSKIGGRSGRG